MPEQERNALIASIIAKIVNQELEGKSTDNTDRYNIGQYYENERRYQGNIEQEGKWYFYNQAALTFGRTEFRKRWGDRRLEDNWRRSNKTRVSNTTAFGQSETTKQGPDTALFIETDYKRPPFYLKNLPLSDSMMLVSNERVAIAMMNAGKAYAERIPDLAKATETLESLITRFPSGELVPEALFTLYNINKETNSVKSESARQRLLQRFPENEFARILSDPSYYQKKIEQLKQAETTYNEAYNAYSNEKYAEAVSISEDALKKYPQDQLAPKFLLLKAYSVGHTSDERLFKDELNNVIKSYPGTTESNKAADLIAYLNQKTPELKVEEDIKIATEIYVADTTSRQIFVLIISDPAFNRNQASFDVISYNIDNFTNKNYKTESLVADNKFIEITVTGFSGFSEAMNYYKSFKTEQIVRNPTSAKMMTFVISAENLKVLTEDKAPERYQLFFQERFLKK
jgi:TolA-binding protein